MQCGSTLLNDGQYMGMPYKSTLGKPSKNFLNFFSTKVLTRGTSALKPLYSCPFTFSTRLIKPNYLFKPQTTQHGSSFNKLTPLFIRKFFCRSLLAVSLRNHSVRFLSCSWGFNRLGILPHTVEIQSKITTLLPVYANLHNFRCEYL